MSDHGIVTDTTSWACKNGRQQHLEQISSDWTSDLEQWPSGPYGWQGAIPITLQGAYLECRIPLPGAPGDYNTFVRYTSQQTQNICITFV